MMFHIVDDGEWIDTLPRIADVTTAGGIFVASGHFGWLDGVNVQIDRNENINKRVRSRRRWKQALTRAGSRSIRFCRNGAYLWIDDVLPENNVLVATL
jgi:hypothetical protein